METTRERVTETATFSVLNAVYFFLCRTLETATEEVSFRVQRPQKRRSRSRRTTTTPAASSYFAGNCFEVPKKRVEFAKAEGPWSSVSEVDQRQR